LKLGLRRRRDQPVPTARNSASAIREKEEERWKERVDEEKGEEKTRKEGGRRLAEM